MALRGWTLPQSPTGRSALLAPPPWHYSGDCIAVDFTADPGTVAGLLPPGMEPAGDGACSIVFADWRAASDEDPRVADDPAISQYQEAYIMLYGTFDGRRVSRVPYMWVSSDLSLVRGLVQGMPKKLGAIAMTRPVEVGRAGVRKAVGGRFVAHLSASGQRRVEVEVVLEEDRTDEDFWPPSLSAPYLNTRLFPAYGENSAGVHELSMASIENVERGRVLSGSASLRVCPSNLDELGELAPVSVGRGHVYSAAFSITGGQSYPAVG